MRIRPAILLFGVLAGCASADHPAAPPAAVQPADAVTPLIGSEWLAEDIDGRGAAAGVRSTLRFHAADQISGSGGCNTYSGGLKMASGTVMFGPIATTRMSCAAAVMDQETRFFDVIVRTRGLEPDGGMLYLLDVTGARIARLGNVVPAA